MPLLLALMLPLAEIALFIVVGKTVGVVATLFVIVASTAIGLALLRDTGLATLAKLQSRPADAARILSAGGARLLAGFLLVIPGFLTSLTAIAVLLVPARLISGLAVVQTRQAGRRPDRRTATTVIEGDFRKLDG